MAIHPNSFTTKQSLQPGARGEIFQQDMPGYRGQGDRINRTNMKLAVSEHDVPNIKWELDRRLPVLFRYGWAHGYNQIVMPKGRFVAVDPSLNILDFDTHKAYNALTLANGGADVEIRKSSYQNVQDKVTAPVGIGTQWAPLNTAAYTLSNKNEAIFRPFKAAGTLEVCEVEEGKDGAKAKTAKAKVAKSAPVVAVDAKTGLVTVDGTVRNDVRLGNKPIGILERNEYTRNDDAYNGMQPGAVLTDKLVELPLFLVKEKAEMNPWGSAYGSMLPGDLVKSDENGRAIVSPLSRPEIVATMTAGEIELERQQVVGQVYAVSRDLVPAGAAKYAQWALSDRLNFDEFNPDVWRMNNRDGEDNISHSPYKANGGGFVNNTTDMTGRDFTSEQGYPFDRTMHEHDLHMLESTVRTHSNRFGLEHMLEQGIPGLTDGYNVASRELGPEEVGTFAQAASKADYRPMMFKSADVMLESMKIAVTTGATVSDDDFKEVNVKEINQKFDLKGDSEVANGMQIDYVDLKQGIITVSVAADKATEVHNALEGKKAKVVLKYKKRGLTGVPTNLDWDGCAGVVTILLQK